MSLSNEELTQASDNLSLKIFKGTVICVGGFIVVAMWITLSTKKPDELVSPQPDTGEHSPTAGGEHL